MSDMHQEVIKAQAAANYWRTEAERLRAAGMAIITANDEFRASLPHGWDGDPIDDACEAAKPLFKNEQSPREKSDLSRERAIVSEAMIPPAPDDRLDKGNR